LTGGEVGDDEYDPYSPEWQRSRAQSQWGSGVKLQHARSRRGSAGKDGVREEAEHDVVGPDFVNMEEEEDEVEGEEVDESEMKEVVMGRVGGWVDWAVGWMDFRGDVEEDGEETEDAVDGDGKDGEEAQSRGRLDPVELQKRLCKKKKGDQELTTGTDNKDLIVTAPEQAGVWNDAKWLLAVATNAAL